jgi:hypothetical protein
MTFVSFICDKRGLFLLFIQTEIPKRHESLRVSLLVKNLVPAQEDIYIAPSGTRSPTTGNLTSFSLGNLWLAGVI